MLKLGFFRNYEFYLPQLHWLDFYLFFSSGKIVFLNKIERKFEINAENKLCKIKTKNITYLSHLCSKSNGKWGPELEWWLRGRKLHHNGISKFGEPN